MYRETSLNDIQELSLNSASGKALNMYENYCKKRHGGLRESASLWNNGIATVTYLTCSDDG